MKAKIVLTLMGVFVLSCFCLFAATDKDLYNKAFECARSGDFNFAFMNYHLLLESYPDSEYRQEALFALGEYYFSIDNYNKAYSYFSKFLNSSSCPEADIFALAYLFRIFNEQGNEELISRMKKTIITQKRLSFIFQDSKSYTYLSPLHNKYKADYFIDKVKFYLNGKFFIQVVY